MCTSIKSSWCWCSSKCMWWMASAGGTMVSTWTLCGVFNEMPRNARCSEAEDFRCTPQGWCLHFPCPLRTHTHSFPFRRRLTQIFVVRTSKMWRANININANKKGIARTRCQDLHCVYLRRNVCQSLTINCRLTETTSKEKGQIKCGSVQLAFSIRPFYI